MAPASASSHRGWPSSAASSSRCVRRRRDFWCRLTVGRSRETLAVLSFARPWPLSSRFQESISIALWCAARNSAGRAGGAAIYAYHVDGSCLSAYRGRPSTTCRVIGALGIVPGAARSVRPCAFFTVGMASSKSHHRAWAEADIMAAGRQACPSRCGGAGEAASCAAGHEGGAWRKRHSATASKKRRSGVRMYE